MKADERKVSWLFTEEQTDGYMYSQDPSCTTCLHDLSSLTDPGLHPGAEQYDRPPLKTKEGDCAKNRRVSNRSKVCCEKNNNPVICLLIYQKLYQLHLAKKRKTDPAPTDRCCMVVVCR